METERREGLGEEKREEKGKRETVVKKEGEKRGLKRESTECGDLSKAEVAVMGLGEAVRHELGFSQRLGKQEWATVDVAVLCFSLWEPHGNKSGEKGCVGAQSLGSGTKLLSICVVAL